MNLLNFIVKCPNCGMVQRKFFTQHEVMIQPDTRCLDCNSAIQFPYNFRILNLYSVERGQDAGYLLRTDENHWHYFKCDCCDREVTHTLSEDIQLCDSCYKAYKLGMKAAKDLLENSKPLWMVQGDKK